MKKLVTAILAISAMAATGAVSADAAATLAEANKALDEVKAAGFEWRLVDKSTGKKSVPLSKLMKVAKKANKGGDAAEAERIAKRIIFAAKGGMAQSKHPGKEFYPAR